MLVTLLWRTPKAHTMFKYGTAITIAATLFASSASAFDPNDVQKLSETGDCVMCDLRGADLSGANLSGADLSGTFLIGADLSDANLSGADLSSLPGGRTLLLLDADLRGTDLSNVDLSGIDLSGALMRGAILCNTTMPDESVLYSGC
jgi:uncharacterized protein YjbI with pentapeptide repeats